MWALAVTEKNGRKIQSIYYRIRNEFYNCQIVRKVLLISEAYIQEAMTLGSKSNPSLILKNIVSGSVAAPDIKGWHLFRRFIANAGGP